MPLIASYLKEQDGGGTVSIGTWRWRVSFWPAQFAVWGAFSILPFLLWLYDILKNQEALFLAAIRPVSGFILTWATRPAWRRLARAKLQPLKFGIAVIAGNFPLALIDYFGSLLILSASGLIPHQTQAPALLTGFFALRWVTLVAWTLLYVNAKQILSNAVLKESLRDAELATLRAQIHPHFLFNALNSIIAEASDSQKVRAITQSLADFLRFSLKQRDGVEPLERELAALENYLLVQKIRFETDLEYHIDTEPRAALCLAPTFLILPLLENALKYGQQTSPSPLRIYIAASIRKERLCIVVKNTGQWVVPDPSASLNTGLANLRRRLHLTYGESASLEIDRTEDGIIASIQIPATQTTS